MQSVAIRIACVMSLFAALVLASPTETDAQGLQPKIMYIAGSAPAPRNDRPIVEHLTDTGYEVVQLADDDMDQALVAPDVDLIMISSSINAVLFEPLLTSIELPIITWDTAIADDLLLGDNAQETKSRRARNWIDIDDSNHPIAGGATGRYHVFSSPSTVSGADPAPSAEVVAISPDGQPTIFTYGANQELIDGSLAASCRTFAFPTWSSSPNLSAAGYDLLTNMVEHALSCEPAVVVDDDFDGFSPPEDCNDDDPSIYPGAVEILDDGIDQDCNGRDRKTPSGDSIQNVVVVMTDDMSYTDYEYMPKTQQLLGAEGVTFEKFYQNTPVCCPARATLLTGQRSLHHGVNTNKPADGEGYEALDHTNTLATWFQSEGYETIHIGKYLNGYGRYSLYPGIQDRVEIPPGWSNFQTLVGNLKYFDYEMNINGEIVQYGNSEAEYQTDVLAERASESIEASLDADNPFFLWVSPFAPHTYNGNPPLPAPRHEHLFDDVEAPRDPSFNELRVNDKPGYVRNAPKISTAAARELDDLWENRIESLQSVDDLVETLYNTLADNGILDNTLFMFLSDNGYMLGQHRLEGKIRPYEESIHVPLVVRGGPFTGGVSIDSVVSSTDLAPTIVSQTEITPQLTMDGLDLSEILTAPELYENRAIIIEMVEGPGYDAVRTEDWMWVEYYGSSTELYDMVADPYQLESQHRTGGSYAAVRAELSEVLDQLRTCVGTECIRYANP